jgi:ZIP family zinc transporter
MDLNSVSKSFLDSFHLSHSLDIIVVTPILFCLLAALSTYMGGLFALKYVDKNHLLLTFAGGSVLGVCFFDLMPESIKLSGVNHSLLFVLIGFAVYYFLNHLMPIATPNQDDCDNPKHKLLSGAWPMCLHSIFDGIGIGLAWKTGNIAIGLTMSVAICLHDWCDGVSVVCMLEKFWNDKPVVLKWLLLDAVAPLMGFGLTFFITMSNTVLGLCLGLFAGFFLYIGAGFLLPETHHEHSKYNLLLAILGAGLIYVVMNFV